MRSDCSQAPQLNYPHLNSLGSLLLQNLAPAFGMAKPVSVSHIHYLQCFR